MHVVGRDHAVAVGGRRPPFGSPAGRRQPVAEGADQHEGEIDRSHGDEGLPDADVGRGAKAAPGERVLDPREGNGERVGTALQAVHQDGRERRADHGSAAEAHDGHAGRHATPVGEPLDERRDRRDVAEAQADAADHAGAKPHQPKLMDVDAERADQQAAAPAQRRDETRLARPDVLEPSTPDGRGNAEQ